MILLGFHRDGLEEFGFQRGKDVLKSHERILGPFRLGVHIGEHILSDVSNWDYIIILQQTVIDS
jgi:hypothetical protein